MTEPQIVRGASPTLWDERLPERFWARVQLSQMGCWQWLGSLRPQGYGYIRFDGEQWRVHRLAYTKLIGEIPESSVLDHLCRNRGCVNPAHLEPVPNRTNVLRGVGRTALQARQTHCIHGHEFTPENTYNPPGKTTRRCRTCRHLETVRRWGPRGRKEAGR